MYGAGDNSSCYQENAGPLIPSIHSGSGHASGTTINQCDVATGSNTYAYRGAYNATTTGYTGSNAMWFK